MKQKFTQLLNEFLPTQYLFQSHDHLQEDILDIYIFTFFGHLLFSLLLLSNKLKIIMLKLRNTIDQLQDDSSEEAEKTKNKNHTKAHSNAQNFHPIS